MTRKKLKGEVYLGRFYAQVEVYVGKDADGVEKLSMWLETSNPFKVTPPATKRRSIKKKGPKKA